MIDDSLNHCIDKRRSEFLDWISTLDFHSTQMDTISRRAAGTVNWFLQDQKFLDWFDGNVKSLWCPGDPGVGKTIICSTIIDYLLRSGVTVVYIYCDYKKQSEQTSTQMLGSILKQLVENRSTISDDLLSLLQTCSSQRCRPTVPELMTALRTELQSYSRVYLVVDALDECSNRAQDLFISTEPQQGLRSLPDNVLLLLTSRDMLSISRQFNDETRLNIQAQKTDLEVYIKGRIIENKRLKGFVETDKFLELEIINEVITKADGSFLQAQLHVDSLASKLHCTAVRAALHELPKKLAESYDAAMMRIKNQGEEESKLANQVFYWLAYAKRSLTIEELQHALAVSDNEEMSDMDFAAIVEEGLLTGVCAGLVVINEEKRYHSSRSNARIVRLVHYTTQQYLEEKQQLLFPTIHSSMTITCLTYLSFNIF
ncbi:hypothetical protein C8J56DRAFT_802076, partial [Mycena floridula]